jgi:hypothetical protein
MEFPLFVTRNLGNAHWAEQTNIIHLLRQHNPQLTNKAQNFTVESDFKTAAKHALSGEVNRKDIRDFGKMDDDIVGRLEDKYEFGSHRDTEKLVRIASISDLSDNYKKIKDLPKGKYVHMCEHVEDVPGRTDWVDVSGALITVAPYTEKLAKSDDTTLIFNL